MVPLTMPMPQVAPPPSPDREKSIFVHFDEEQVAFCTPTEITQMMKEEKALVKSGMPQAAAERRSELRQYYEGIPQPDKPGPDRVSPQYTSSAILTEDLLVGYFDEVRRPNGEMGDVLHIVLVKPREEGSVGWVLPGMRDRAYGPEHEDISIEDANGTLVQKEIGVGRADIAYHIVLSVFDDRKREDRFRSSTIVGMVLLHGRPTLEPGKRIGVPLNVLKLLAERRIKLPMQPGDQGAYGLSRNHDSMLKQLFKTAKFHHTLEKLKLAQADWRELLRVNPAVPRPGLKSIDPKQECPVCLDLMVGARVICAGGHSICGVCLPIIQTTREDCPTCHEELFERPIPNRNLEDLIQILNPEEYQQRFQEMHGEPPKTWEQDPHFCGDAITYRA